MISNKVIVKPTLSVWDAIGLIVGIVIGAAIFETPASVAAKLGNEWLVILAWVLGGVISLIGALCYAELTTTYPHPGGGYYYLQRSFGQRVAFLFAWARLAVVQTGSIALLAFVFGDYMSQLYRLGAHSTSIYAALSIVALTLLNWIGIRQGTRTQNLLALLQVVGLGLVCLAGLFLTPSAAPTVTALPTTSRNFGLTMVFVLLTYGGWNEAAYISAELRNVQRNMTRSLFWSIGIITGLYVLINLAFLHGLGILSMASSEAVAADLMRQTFGEPGVVFISALVAITTLCSINASIFTGARTNYALGRDFLPFAWMGRWNQSNPRPQNPNYALWVQTAIALLLVAVGSLSRRGFEAMVDYTAPVFWFFFLLTGISLFILRHQEPNRDRPFQVPLYPMIPILFCLVCAYMLYSSLVYTEWYAILGVAVLLAGIPLLWIEQRMKKQS
jgi:basic amino acid/polyamine antiporter, APA family